MNSNNNRCHTLRVPLSYMQIYIDLRLNRPLKGIQLIIKKIEIFWFLICSWLVSSDIRLFWILCLSIFILYLLYIRFLDCADIIVVCVLLLTMIVIGGENNTHTHKNKYIRITTSTISPSIVQTPTWTQCHQNPARSTRLSSCISLYISQFPCKLKCCSCTWCS